MDHEEAHDKEIDLFTVVKSTAVGVVVASDHILWNSEDPLKF